MSTAFERAATAVIERWLAAEGVPYHITGPTPEVPHAFVTAAVGDDANDDPIEVTIQARQEDGSMLEDDADAGAPRLLHLASVYPVTIVDGGWGELMRFVCLLNASVPLPGFVVDERHGHVLYRYTAMLTADALDVRLLEQAISHVVLQREVFAGPFKALASGAQSFEETLRSAGVHLAPSGT